MPQGGLLPDCARHKKCEENLENTIRESTEERTRIAFCIPLIPGLIPDILEVPVV